MTPEEVYTHFPLAVHVGSRVTCDPAPTGTDYDFIVPADRGWFGNSIEDKLEDLGFVEEGEKGSYTGIGNDFYSYRKGLINIVVAENQEFYEAFLLATDVAKALNLLLKEDRIKLFQAMLYKVSPL